MAEVEVWIMGRGAVQLELAVAALEQLANQPARFGLVKVEGMKSGYDAVVGRVFVRDGSPAEIPRTAIQKALDEVANQNCPILEQEIICFPLH